MHYLNKSFLYFWFGLALSVAVQIQAAEMTYELGFYEIRVNGQDAGVGQILHSDAAGYLVTAEDLDHWGLIQINAAPFSYNGAKYYPLNVLKGYKPTFDSAKQELALEFDPAAFKPTAFTTQAESNMLSAAESGSYFNYDLYGMSGSSPMLNQTQLNGQFEVGVFNGLGAGFSSFSGQNLYTNSNDINVRARYVRLDSNWIRDFPEDRFSLKFGDNTGRNGVWGRPVKFGGVQFGTNFATQPGFVTLPLPVFKGEAALPSTTDIYINGVNRSSQTVSPGPFQISNVPMITGAGEAKMVVRDMMGREQVIVQPFYVTPSMLRPGVEDYTVELGFIRQNYGIDQFSYGRPMAVGTQRKGFSDKLTVEGRVEVLSNQQTAGLAATYIPPFPVAITAATALSNSARGSGDYLLLGIDHQALGGMNFGLRSQFYSNNFTQIGAGLQGQSKQITASMGLPTKMGSFGLSYIYARSAAQLRNESISTSYSTMLGKRISLSASLYTALSGAPNQMLNVFLAFPMSDGIFSSGNFSQQQGKLTGSFMVQKSPPVGIGPQWGYRSQVGGGQGQNEAIGITLRTDYGEYVVDAGRMPGQTSYRMSASGSVEYKDGNLYLSRRLYDSYAVAQVPGYPDVPVYVNGQLIALTDKQGYAILPGLASFQKNKIRIDTNDLPFEAQIEKTEYEVVPHYHSGVSLKFSVSLSIGALVKLVNEKGELIPNGAVVAVEGVPEEFLVALQGEVYLTGIAKKNRMKVTWNGNSCDIAVDLPENPGPLPHIGPLVCKGIKP